VAIEGEVPKDIMEAEPAKIIVEAELALPVWDDLEPSATEPESFEPQEALDIMDETADEFGDDVSEEASATTESAGGEAATEEPRSRRRRRRRGRGRGREGAPSAEAQTANEFGDELADDEGVVSESMEGDIDGSAREPADDATLEGERTERRGHRRRRGRGRPRDQVRDAQTEGEESAVDDEDFDFEPAEEEATVDAGPSGERDFDDDEEHDGEHDFEGDEEHDEDGVDSPRIGFRNIPTWQDAIGVMIAKNMESRSRNPGGSRGPSGRGGRGGAGRGRGRRPDRR